ncbi:MAG: ABC transporter permease, partial [Planctomycetota bacterium]|nr:ABC transporter permease [Planctomycetota bacterium]
MTIHLKTAWRNILYSRRQTIAVSLLALFAMALMSIASFLGRNLREGLTAAVEPFDMLVGRGGSYQMVLNTVFLQDYPAGNIPYRLVGELNGDPRIRRAIPLAFGDNHRGYRIVGTDVSIFSHFAANADRGPWLRFVRGAPFSPGSREAVVGSGTAADLGLKIGDSLVSSHGFVPGGEEHEQTPYVVSGILASCRGPYDRAIFVDIRSIWEAHGLHGDHDGETEKISGRDDGDGHPEENEAAPNDEGGREVTAIMVKPAGFAGAYQLYAEFNSRRDADLVFPAQVVVRLLSILGQADWLLQAIGYAAGAIAA